MNCNTNVVQVTNVSPSTTSEQMRTLFGFLGTVEDLRLFPPDDSTMPVTSRVCFVRFKEQESVGVSQHLTNTVFVDRALIVVPYAEGVIPDESKALSLLAPANAVAGLLPGGGLLPTPNPLASMGGVPLGALGAPAMLPGAGMNPQGLSADQLLKLMTSVDPKMNPMAAGMGLKADASSKEIEEAMKRVREAQSLISAAIEPGNKKDSKRKHSRSRSRSRSRRRRSRSRSRHRRSGSRNRRRSRSRSRRRSRSPRRRRSRSRDRSRRSTSKSRDRKKEEKDKKRSKTPPKSYSSARRSRSTSRRRRRSVSRSPRRSPKKRTSRSPSPRRHKKEKKRDREREKERERDRRSDRDRSRDESEHSSSKKKKGKDKERERRSDSEKRDVKVTRDYDEEEQGYDSEKERELKDSEDSGASPTRYVADTDGNASKASPKQAKQNGDDRHDEQDMEVSD
ncbi:serine/arginine-rich splicing factor 11-like isoform X1 [Electrophorus electricus]|uniref:RRM domain-containing protein n=2 Tax=Electrophorus electricus TaxID=8005 RepID=A0A4W4GXJ7_ELEEL|nr:serine/arginine-rich splicing factor 11-like isoform X1 [Electrophorus electricus]